MTAKLTLYSHVSPISLIDTVKEKLKSSEVSGHSVVDCDNIDCDHCPFCIRDRDDKHEQCADFIVRDIGPEELDNLPVEIQEAFIRILFTGEIEINKGE